MNIRILFRHDKRSYLYTCLLGLLAGAIVAAFSNFPADTLWSFSSFSSATIGFWTFTTSLIVLTSKSPFTAGMHGGIYVGLIFLVTAFFKAIRGINDGYSTFSKEITQIPGMFCYAAIPAVICGILGAVLWYGRKNNWYGKLLLVLPLLVIALETAAMYANV